MGSAASTAKTESDNTKSSTTQVPEGRQDSPSPPPTPPLPPIESIDALKEYLTVELDLIEEAAKQERREDEEEGSASEIFLQRIDNHSELQKWLHGNGFLSGKNNIAAVYVRFRKRPNEEQTYHTFGAVAAKLVNEEREFAGQIVLQFHDPVVSDIFAGFLLRGLILQLLSHPQVKLTKPWVPSLKLPSFEVLLGHLLRLAWERHRVVVIIHGLGEYAKRGMSHEREAVYMMEILEYAEELYEDCKYLRRHWLRVIITTPFQYRARYCEGPVLSGIETVDVV
ncbi:hypothetical protein BDV95DRAFT_603786 [Massariosphaeria phaeospora]|uniref:Uncharacterized protein n=1 Tax=Massariosphaeria phaeospora TaxID=100035 RepID=A0A7C8IFG9_9PLEO|nr:hypothetical protein BDV95DRAFT_603786 [Massariosphaeria phaeospora]